MVQHMIRYGGPFELNIRSEIKETALASIHGGLI